MNNTFKTLLSGLALSAVILSCQKETDSPSTTAIGDMVPVTFSANVGAVTKVSLTPNGDDTAFTSAWENEDGMKLYYLNGNYEEGTVDAAYDEANSKWNTTLPGYNGEWNYVASYPAASDIPFGAARTQTGNAYNPAYDIMQGEVNVTSGEAGKDDAGKDIVFPMERLTAIQYFHFTSDLDEKVYKATLSVGNTDSDIAATTVNISAGALVVATGGSKSITLTFPDGLEPNASDFKLWFNVLPAFFESMTIDIETASHTKHIERAIGGGIGEYEAGKLYKVSGKITDWVIKDKVFLEARFDDNNGTGGNDGSWNGSIASSDVVGLDDWDLTKVNGAYKCIKGGSGSAKGIAITPSLPIPTAYRGQTLKLYFRAGAWNGTTEQTTLMVSVTGTGASLSSSSVATSKGSWKEYTLDITTEASTSNVIVTFEGATASNARFFLDDVCMYYGARPKKDAELSYADPIIYKSTDDEPFTISLSNPNSLSVTYDSSDPTVATVDSEGEVTILKKGTTRISATSAETSEFRSGEAHYDLTVSAPPTLAFSWTRAGSADTITSGYTMTRAKTKTGTTYWQENANVGEESSIRIYNSSTAMFTSTPSTILLTVTIGAGSSYDITNSVYACLVDSSGDDIDGTQIEITSNIANASGDLYEKAFTPISTANGVRVYHTKEASVNIRYFSMNLKFNE